MKTKISKKLYISLFAIIFIAISLLAYQFFSYTLLIRNFTSLFEGNQYSDANNTLVTSENFNPFKAIFLEKDLSNYFENKLNKLSSSIEKNEIPLDDALVISKEIYRYKVTSLDDSILFANYKNNYLTTGKAFYEAKDFKKAFEQFKKVPENDYSYNEAQEYLTKCKDSYKNSLLSEIDLLSKEHYYSKSILLIEESESLLGKDQDLQNKLDELKATREEYLAEMNSDKQASSLDSVKEITTVNINNLNLESKTDYLIHISKSHINIYKGTSNNWTLNKAYTKTESNDSKANGVYSLKELNDYLFATLTERDINWINDNVQQETKVIIK